MVLNHIYKKRNYFKVSSEDRGDDSRVTVFKCKSTRCGLRNQFIAKDKTISPCSKRVCDCIKPNGTIYVDYHTALLFIY